MKILILTASVGAGHNRAAEALETAFNEKYPGIYVKTIDVLETTNKVFKSLYGSLYFDLANNLPHTLGYLYDLLDKPSETSKNIRILIEKLNLWNLIKLLNSEKWDCIINTHFLSAEIIASLGNIKQFIVTTDFDTHRLWVNQPCELYFTATQEGAESLISYGVPRKDVLVTGIPIHPKFSLPFEKPINKIPKLLHMSGGFGIGSIEDIFQQLLRIEIPIDLTTLTGKNEEARIKLSKIHIPEHHKVSVIGFTKEVDKLMKESDIVISKPGGLTTSEVLASGCMMVIVNPIPGQEDRNSDYLLEQGVAVKVNNLAVLPWKIKELIENPRKVKNIGKPRAVFDIIEAILQKP